MRGMSLFRFLLVLPLLLCCSCVTRTSGLVFRHAQPVYSANIEDLRAGKGKLYTDGKEQYVELPRYRVHSYTRVVGTMDDRTRHRYVEEGTALYRVQHALRREYSGMRNGRQCYTMKTCDLPRLDARGGKPCTVVFSPVPAEEAEAVKARCKVRPARQEHLQGRSTHSESRWYTPAVYAAGIPLLVGVDVPLTVAQNLCLLPLAAVIALWPDPEGKDDEAAPKGGER